MALALKEELHRLVDEIPESDPRWRLFFETVLRVLAERPDLKTDPLSRSLREAAETYFREGPESAGATDVGTLPRVLAEAPEDDEPLTPEEIEMLDSRLRALETTPAIPHEEVLRRLRS